MSQAANAVLTKARAMFGRMLTSAQYDELLRKQSVQEISAYLRDKTTYAKALAGVQDSTVHRGQLESLLHKDMLYQSRRILRYAPAKSGLLGSTIIDTEIKLILACLRGIISGKQEDLIASIPSFMQNDVSFPLFGLVGVTSVPQLITAVNGTPYAMILRRCLMEHPEEGRKLVYTNYEVALRSYYYESLLTAAKLELRGNALKQANALINLRAELMNLNAIYRMKTFFHATPEQIRRSILPFYGRLTSRTLNELIETKDSAAFMQLLSKTTYGDKIDPENGFIESQTDYIRYQFCLHMLRFSTSPTLVYMAFILLRGMETENIIRIIEGVRYGLPPERIGKMLYNTGA